MIVEKKERGYTDEFNILTQEKQPKIKALSMHALFIALTFVATMFINIKLPNHG